MFFSDYLANWETNGTILKSKPCREVEGCDFLEEVGALALFGTVTIATGDENLYARCADGEDIFTKDPDLMHKYRTIHPIKNEV